jgi:hypothetical protein
VEGGLIFLAFTGVSLNLLFTSHVVVVIDVDVDVLFQL